MLLLSILCQLARYLLGLIAVLVRRDLSKDAELLVLRHEENAVLRRQVARVRYRPADRCGWPPCPVGATPPLGRGLRGHACHDPGLAPQAGR
jgi:hypothetical protein